jgi:Resolvase, N terminal domain
MSHRAAIYARVSTLNTQNPEMQLAELREYAARRGWEVTSEYVDLGVSGSKESRPELNRMLAAAHSPAFDAVVCWKLDRLGRSLKQLVTTIEDLSAYGVAFISLRDNFDPSTPSGRLMMHIFGAMAQFERELIKERVSAGMRTLPGNVEAESGGLGPTQMLIISVPYALRMFPGESSRSSGVSAPVRRFAQSVTLPPRRNQMQSYPLDALLTLAEAGPKWLQEHFASQPAPERQGRRFRAKRNRSVARRRKRQCSCTRKILQT